MRDEIVLEITMDSKPTGEKDRTGGNQAIIHHFRPDLFEENFQNTKDPQRNLKLAFDAATKLGIPSLLTVEELTDKEKPVDPSSIITYLSHFYKLFFNESPVQTAPEASTPHNEETHCRKCRKPLTGATIKFEKWVYHQKCFECAQCGKQLSGKCVSISRKPYCEGCGKKTWNETIRAKSMAKENEAKRKDMQMKAFTVWVNHQLAARLGTSAPVLKNLSTDLSNGVVLIELILSLYKDKVKPPHYNKKPTLQVHYLDNVITALNLLKQVGLDLPFLKPQSDSKMIFGLLWQLILDTQLKLLPANKSKIGTTEDDAPKNSLLQWCQQRVGNYKGVKIDDFHGSFQDGMAFLALIHSFKPDAVNYDSLDPSKKKENLEQAFKLASEHLGIPKLLDVEDMLSVKPDERSVMTYVSTFALYFFSMQQQKDKQKEKPVEEKKAPAPVVETKTIEVQTDDLEEFDEDITEDSEMPVNSVDTFQWEDVKLEGYLNKQDVGFFKFWRRMYFILRGSRLLYYKDKESATGFPDSYVSLSFAKSVEENKAKQNSFMVSTRGRVYYLQAETPQDAKKWIDGLNKAITIWKEKDKSKQQRSSGTTFNISTYDKEYKEGYMQYLNFMSIWRPQFYVLKDGILFSYKNKGEPQTDRIPLYGCVLEEYPNPDDPTDFSSFKVTTKDGKVWYLKAESEAEMHKWLNAILRQKVIIDEFVGSIVQYE